MEIRQKKNPLAFRLSRSLKVVGTVTDRSATYDLLLVVRSNYGPIFYRFQDKRRFRSKITNSPVYITTLPGEFPFEFGNGGRAIKSKGHIPIPESGKSLTMCAFVSVQYQSVTDGRTDGRTDGFA